MEEIKRSKRGSRPDIVRENGKIYYKVCKCGIEKESYKMPMCLKCNNTYYIEMRGRRNAKNIIVRDLVIKGSNKDVTILEKPGKYHRRLLVEFVNKIERRNGLASLEDIFVDLITLFNYFGCNQDIDPLPTDTQLSMMWNFIKEYKNKIENIKR